MTITKTKKPVPFQAFDLHINISTQVEYTRLESALAAALGCMRQHPTRNRDYIQQIEALHQAFCRD